MPGPRLPRHCLVTTGSMASFRQLLEEVLSPPFLHALVDHGFDHMEIQCGPDLGFVESRVVGLGPAAVPLSIRFFSFAASEEMQQKMLLCRGEAGRRHAGVVVGHAG
jgi:UDP-N-acetylglucosamine transferase subunit ALG13